MSTLQVGTIRNASGVEVYTAKAWVNFNGTGTVAIRASGNVSSITDNGTGDYTVNFTTSMPDASYSSTSYAGLDANNGGLIIPAAYSSSNHRFSVFSVGAGPVKTDYPYVNLAIFR